MGKNLNQLWALIDYLTYLPTGAQHQQDTIARIIGAYGSSLALESSAVMLHEQRHNGSFLLYALLMVRPTIMSQCIL